MQVRNKHDKIAICGISVLVFIFSTSYISDSPISERTIVHLKVVSRQVLNILYTVFQGSDFKLVSYALGMS